ncbi:hypothetical protein [Nonomuraea lactucae]|uniref:hypothetical protein n=1 Tax=Nonomuraea lactucae TaxID=2249762 RepID=UPI000DE3A150|nr:hypothetical protein [Nonomuraea lactucae]
MEGISCLSKVYLYIPIEGASGTEGVEVAFTTAGVEPVEGDWQLASWGQVSGRGREARILIGPGAAQLTEGTYQAWVRITGAVERPVLPAGLIDLI